MTRTHPAIRRASTPDLDAFGPLVLARVQYEMGCVAWAAGHAPSAKVAAVDLNFSPDEIESDDARAIVSICLRDFATHTPLIADACRVALMRIGPWFDRHAAISPDTLHLRQWSEWKLARLFQHNARTIAEIGIKPVDRYLAIVAEGFRSNVELLRAVAGDEKRIRDAMRFVKAQAGAERRASP